MCEYCGCTTTPEDIQIKDGKGVIRTRPADETSIEVLTGILDENDKLAGHIRDHLADHKVLAVNLMSSPGSGKTSLLEATIDALESKYRIAVIEGDLETENDADRIRAKGVPAIQVVTGQTCHLDANMVHDALHALDLSDVDILFIENVGNLVCPASFDLGQKANVVLLSSTEGDDKPAKYPVMFRGADLVLITKADLIPVLDDFNPENARRHIRELANDADAPEVSARRPETLEPWLHWLDHQVAEVKAASADRPAAHAHHHHHHDHGEHTHPHAHTHATILDH
ncbi:MAG: hydrogenase nickel incorporation protein HypB [Hyphomicrobiaceae bacterium]|nr:hydrogenase nickel incorporation protein HypB [Hyphomicrobiaceae bacterium]MCC0023114.1 hydrogenase nickel incorporation protein HypB [Hyphomicrobiaceae bacterium]